MGWFGWRGLKDSVPLRAMKPARAEPPEREERIIHLAGEAVPYLLKRSARRKTIALRIDGKGCLTVNAPARASQRRLDALLQEKAGWVLTTLAEVRARRVPAPAWRDGETLPFLGGELRLALCQGSARKGPELDGDCLVVALPDPLDDAAVQSRVVKWYRQQALAHFAARVAVYAGHLGVAHPPLRLSSAATRWGSCNARGEIRLNWRLIKAPHHLIDYVVAHELSHLRHLDHSPRFWRTVAQLYPDHAVARSELRAQGHLLHTF